VGPETPLRGFHDWRWRASYSYYGRRPIPNIETDEALEAYWGRAERVCVIVERGRLQRLQGVLGPQEPLEQRAVGGNAAYLFCNRPE
jgi:hypothetical protein